MNKNIKYFLYCRKSSESDERQVQSLDDQIRIMTAKAKLLWIEIVDQFVESMSAKEPGRYKFDEMIQRIQKKEANGIITWQYDRLSRNPIDSGTIQFMLQRWSLEKIITNDREYTKEESGLLMSVESGMANQYILNLIKNVKRGLDSKCQKGIRPNLVPIGYLNDVAHRSIISDPNRFDIVRRMWDLMLTGTYSIRKVIDKANEEWWLRTVQKRKSWWWPLSRSSGERIFRNIFYAGYFEHRWELIKGIHEPMITMEEFNRVQMLLWKKNGKPRPKTRHFSYTWMITCWYCWCMVTAETKNKYIKSTAETKEYTYYHCTKKKREAKCTQKCISIENLEDQIVKVLESIEIDMEFQQWVYEAIKENFNSEFETRQKIYESILSSIETEKNRRKKLTDMYLDELISKEEFEKKKSDILRTIAVLEEKRDTTDMTGNRNMELTEKVFELALGVTESFNSWSIQRKKDVFHALGKNFVLQDYQRIKSPVLYQLSYRSIIFALQSIGKERIKSKFFLALILSDDGLYCTHEISTTYFCFSFFCDLSPHICKWAFNDDAFSSSSFYSKELWRTWGCTMNITLNL